MRKIHLAAATASAAVALTLAGCSHAGSAKSAAASVTANPTVAAELHQAKSLVESCFPGTLVQQARTVHLVFLSSATGKHGPAVTAARDKTFGCLGISDPAKRQAFVNDAGEAALHASPKLTTHDGRVRYFSVTLPQLVLRYGSVSASASASAS